MNLGYDVSGQGDVLLLVHGFPVDRRIWEHQLRGIGGGRRVVAVDLRGRGKSPARADGGWTIDDHADDLAETVDSLGVDRVDLAGLSMGGYVAFALLRRHPEKLRSLILMSTKADADTDAQKAGRDETARLVLDQGPAVLIERMLSNLLSEEAPEAVRKRLVEIILSLPPETAAADSMAMRDRPDSTPDLASISVPTVVIQGADDPLLDVTAGRGLAAKIQGARFVPIEGARHFVPLEKPDEVNRTLREFLETLSSA
ncbi:MAG: alpha/beta hydrolase [Actinomycetota bacterium]|nr:alpha/beta hydrolase [Actinomycetota bacterium]